MPYLIEDGEGKIHANDWAKGFLAATHFGSMFGQKLSMMKNEVGLLFPCGLWLTKIPKSPSPLK
jgi:hypothetical protein